MYFCQSWGVSPKGNDKATGHEKPKPKKGQPGVQAAQAAVIESNTQPSTEKSSHLDLGSHYID